MLKVAVLVSGGGSNLQSILDYGQETFKVEMVIGSKEGIYGLERAKNAGIPSYVVSKKEYEDTLNQIKEHAKSIELSENNEGFDEIEIINTSEVKK